MRTNELIDILIEDSKKRSISLDSILFIQVNDTISIKNACSLFKDVYAMNTVPFIMRELKMMIRQFKNIHPLFSNDLVHLSNVDATIVGSKEDLRFFNSVNSRYIAVLSDAVEIDGFIKVEDGLFIRNDDIFSSSNDINDKTSMMTLKNIKPVLHCYGKLETVDEGRTDFIGAEAEKVLEARKTYPYSQTWLFRKTSQDSSIDNEIILKEDISEEDMVKIVEILSKSEYKKIIK